ncbi:XRE family transcriptional regulator [Paenibacillus sp. MER 180]|uniref:Cupin domain-containing protein n=1 Tax=Paenibacillus popilliae TaxID=78057 RepID=A0ABY3AQ91_PAEPP|nr:MULTISPECIES: XRE family transcriptional regulator [unclassified Paenibacillus]MCM3292232.1 XRE family transcriptional regulator [Paenibacillus sp. MER 180]OBY77871.1 DNA-binding protein [Paenibacillus sp. KS1]TQR43266.1 cupin domain-containing protein [Paenibacillus sp. SDF0028]
MDIGSTIRAIRKRKNITIAQICEETGLSQGFMSQVETNKTSPSISTLENIAKALKVPLAYLLLKKEDRMNIVRKDERSITTSGSDKLTVQHLSSTKNVRMMVVEFPPGASTGIAPHAHEGEEVHIVIEGRIYAEQGEDAAEFEKGDSFSWNACTPHLVKNIGDDTAIVLISIYTENDNNRELI